MDELKTYIKAGFPLVQIVTAEEGRAVAEIQRLAMTGLRSTERPHGYDVWTWSVTTGLIDADKNPVVYNVVPPKTPQTSTASGSASSPPSNSAQARSEMDSLLRSKDPITALTYFMNGNVMPHSIVVMLDLHIHLKSGNPMLIRLMKDAIQFGKMTNRHIIIVGCEINRPPELEKDMVCIDLPLPSAEQVGSIVDSICKSARKTVLPEDKEKIVRAALGLTSTEASNAMAFSMMKVKRIDPEIISTIKIDTIRRNGILDVVETKADAAHVGGLAAVKEWIKKRIRAFTPEAEKFGVPTPKGVMVIGVSGTGKSLVGNTIATSLGVPMLRLEGSKIFNQYVGESERNMRNAIHTADIMSPCVLFIDELEKVMSGSSGRLDSGVSSRVLGTLLQWMNDKKTKVFVVATANNISQLPPELLRRGRFDQIFFVDLPDAEDRESIWKIHIARIGRKPEDFDTTHLAGLTDGFTGAEIASIVDDGLVNAFDLGCEPTTKIMEQAVSETVPLSRTMREQLGQMRSWAEHRAVNASGKAPSRPKVEAGNQYEAILDQIAIKQ